MTAVPDILEYIRAALTSDPHTLAQVEPVLRQARQTYGGETIYVRTPERSKISRRTIQRRMRMA